MTRTLGGAASSRRRAENEETPETLARSAHLVDPAKDGLLGRPAFAGPSPDRRERAPRFDPPGHAQGLRHGPRGPPHPEQSRRPRGWPRHHGREVPGRPHGRSDAEGDEG